MDIQILTILAYIVILIAVIARLFRSAGWNLTPAYVNGKFQINVIPIIIMGFVASIPIMDTVNLIGAITLQAQIALLFTIFTGVYGTTASLDYIGDLLTTTPPSNEDNVA
ncbi:MULTISPECIES: hypothetical protein [Methanobacterium]|uniref:Uncharacterized protein n=1 Tax=Methanobacterium bryantii TaxID=2161 RepID=A0A2A2H8K5_METBR|nr:MULTISPECIES: hypothetical protein [Methanobacterium]OEC87875.1 hypothetical protein A9507_06785 [Methanobacterium sp. A39]PAV05742.1 hypothetical protein ASJ80_08395 [Methanobacterium bryantii]